MPYKPAKPRGVKVERIGKFVEEQPATQNQIIEVRSTKIQVHTLIEEETVEADPDKYDAQVVPTDRKYKTQTVDKVQLLPMIEQLKSGQASESFRQVLEHDEEQKKDGKKDEQKDN